LDKHLSLIAQQHLETRFIKLDVEKAPFLTQRLGIRVIPTMGIIKDGKTKVLKGKLGKLQFYFR